MKNAFYAGSVAVALSAILVACSDSSSKDDNSNAAGKDGGAGKGGASGKDGASGKGSGGKGGDDAGMSSGSGGAPAANNGAAGWQAYMDPRPADTGTVERGQYLVDNVLVCGVCHTPSDDNGNPNPELYLAGSRPYNFTDIDGTVVTVNAENLTSHDPEGLHAWSDGQIRTAITKGVDDEHYAIYPIMPYPEYSLLKKEDVDSIIQYLRTVPPNDNVVAADYPRPDINPPAKLVDGDKIPHTTLDKSDPDYAAAERGRYLASVACLNCHTEEVVQSNGMIDHDNPNLTKAFAGGKHYAFDNTQPDHTSVNITPDKTGLADWSVDDIVAAIKSNKQKDTGKAFCNTHPGGPERYGKMKDEDVMDIATYIHTLPPVKNGPFECIQK